MNYYEMLLLLVQKRRFIILTTVAFTMIALVFSLLVPARYKATTVLMPPVAQSVNPISLLTRGNMMSDPELGGTGLLPGVISPSDIFAFMLKSGTVKRRVIDECGLVNHYKQGNLFKKNPDKAMYNVSKKLTKNTGIRVTTERFIAITVEDMDKKKAAEIANSYASSLDKVYAGITMSQGSFMREFIEKRLLQEEAVLRAMEDSLRAFQERHRTVSITDEMKAVIEMAGQIEAKIVSQKIERDALKAYSSADNMQLMVLDKQIEVARQELDNLMKGRTAKALFIPYSKAPEVGLQLSRLMRDVKMHQEVYLLLVQQLEQAKIIEAKDTPRIQVLERAEPPYRKSWPKRSLLVLSGLLLGAMASGLYVLGFEYYVKYIEAGGLERKEKLERLLGNKI